MEELDVDCSFRRLPAYIYTTEERRRAELEAECAAAQGLGLPASLTTEIDLPFPVEAAVRFDDQALFDEPIGREPPVDECRWFSRPGLGAAAWWSDR